VDKGILFEPQDEEADQFVKRYFGGFESS